MAIIEKKSIGGDVEKLEPLYPNDENANSRSHSENSMEGPQKIKHTATLRPSLFVQKNWNQDLKEIGTPVFTATMFTAAEVWKQPKCPSTDKWLSKMQHTRTVEHYSEDRSPMNC